MDNKQIEPLSLTNLFDVEDILISQEQQSNFNAIRSLVRLIVRHHDLPDETELFNAVLMRERASTTMIGHEMALPHARVAGLKRPYIAVGVFPRGVLFNPENPTATPPRLLFLLLVPEDQPGLYLQVLRALTTIVRETATVSALSAMKTPEEVMAYFRRTELMLPGYICAADLMNEHFAVLNETEPLSHALDFFVEGQMEEVPVVDRTGEMLGVVNVRLILNKVLPFILKQAEDDPSPANLAPLAQLVNHCKTIGVGDVYTPDYASVQVDVPVMAVAEEMAAHDATVCYVLSGCELVGVVSLGRFIGRILRE